MAHVLVAFYWTLLSTSFVGLSSVNPLYFDESIT